jgi:hypothetical protein
MTKIEDLVLRIVCYAEQVKDAIDSQARYNAAFELKLTAEDLEASVLGNGNTYSIVGVNTTRCAGVNDGQKTR